MYAIRLFLLVGLVTLSYASPIEENCKDVPAKEKLDNSAFFKGTWYLTHSLPKEDRACMSIKSELNETMVKEIYTIIEKTETDKAEAYIDLSSVSGSGKFHSKVKEINRKPQATTKFIKLDKTVIDTDYENYAIVYNCFPEADGPSIYVVMSRNPDPDQVHPNVEKVLDGIGMKLMNFATTKHLSCPKVD